MRLIDADALLERMKKDPLFTLVERYGVSGVIDAEPTVKPKTGHWMWSVDEYGESWFCSECLSEYVAEEGIPTWANYCPNCGTNVIFRNQGRRKGWLQAWRDGEVIGK